jgi:Tol biopolymer transport system component
MRIAGTPLLLACSFGAAQAQICNPNLPPKVAPDSRYVLSQPVAGEFVVTDLETNLVWKQCAEGLSGASCSIGTISTLTWQAALSAAANSSFAGSEHWRLPNVQELQSLVETSCFSPSLNTTLFPGASGSSVPYWSSTTFQLDATAAWQVFFHVGTLTTNNKSALQQVRLVRAGQPFSGYMPPLPLDRQVASLTPGGDDASRAPRSDASGRYVVFESQAANLLGAGVDTNGDSDVFRMDRDTGSVIRVSVNTDGSQSSGGDSIEPSISADGNFVVFVAPESVMTRLSGESRPAAEARIAQAGFGVFLRNLVTGTTQRLGSGLASGSGSRPQIAPDGNAVVFTGTNVDPAQGAMNQDNVFRMPLTRVGNALVPQLGQPECVSCKSRSTMGAAVDDADGASRNATLSSGGHYVAYETTAKNSLAGTASPCPGASSEIILRNLVLNSTQRISPPPGLAPAGCGTSGSRQPSMDYSGQNIAFESDQPLKPGDVNLQVDVFLTTVGSNSFLRPSDRADAGDADGASTQASISGDGQTVAFVSTATNLDTSFVDTNGKADIHARRRGLSGGAQRLSKSTTGVQANEAANRPALNYNGTSIVFDSAASNLVSGDGAVVDVFERALPANADVVYSTGFE